MCCTSDNHNYMCHTGAKDFWNPYDKTNNLTLFSEKSEHVSIFDPCGTLKVNGGHLGNATICGISEKYCFCFVYTLHQISHF